MRPMRIALVLALGAAAASAQDAWQVFECTSARVPEYCDDETAGPGSSGATNYLITGQLAGDLLYEIKVLACNRIGLEAGIDWGTELSGPACNDMPSDPCDDPLGTDPCDQHFPVHFALTMGGEYESQEVATAAQTRGEERRAEVHTKLKKPPGPP